MSTVTSTGANSAANEAATAAFFANKKKKKTFKFNANFVDASTVASTLVHVDAPAVLAGDSSMVATTAADLTGGNHISPDADDDDDQWIDPAGNATHSRTGSVAAAAPLDLPVASSTTTTATTMSFLVNTSSKHDDHHISEKLRVEETKAQLAAARAGMEQKAAKLREEQEEKKRLADAKAAGLTGSVSSSTTTAGGKWMSSRVRQIGGSSGGLPGSSLSSFVGGSRFGNANRPLDTNNEELFPDLATAGKIIEQQQKAAAPALKAGKKPPSAITASGASWGSEKANSTSTAPPSTTSSSDARHTTKADAEPSAVLATRAVDDAMSALEIHKSDNQAAAVTDAVTSSDVATEPATTAPVLESSATPAVKKLTTTRKKKDLSTFKA